MAFLFRKGGDDGTVAAALTCNFISRRLYSLRLCTDGPCQNFFFLKKRVVVGRWKRRVNTWGFKSCESGGGRYGILYTEGQKMKTMRMRMILM